MYHWCYCFDVPVVREVVTEKGGVTVKIGICGTHCSGKTTLATEVSRRFGLPLIQEVAGLVPRERRKSVGAQIDIMFSQMKQELVRSAFVSDRTLIDNRAYYEYWASKSGTVSGLDANVDAFVRDYLKNEHYDWIFFVDEYFELEDDGQRDLDPDQQVWIYQYLKNEYNDLKRKDIYPYLNVAKLNGTTDERLDQMIECGVFDSRTSKYRNNPYKYNDYMARKAVV